MAPKSAARIWGTPYAVRSTSTRPERSPASWTARAANAGPGKGAVGSSSLQRGEKPGVDHRISRDDGGILESDVPAAHVGDQPARFPDQEHAGREVPRRQAQLPEPVEAAGGHVHEI